MSSGLFTVKHIFKTIIFITQSHCFYSSHKLQMTIAAMLLFKIENDRIKTQFLKNNLVDPHLLPLPLLPSFEAFKIYNKTLNFSPLGITGQNNQSTNKTIYCQLFPLGEFHYFWLIISMILCQFLSLFHRNNKKKFCFQATYKNSQLEII